MMFFGVLITVLAVIIISVIWWMNNLSKIGKFFKSVPGPPTIPILGNALELTKTTAILQNVYEHTKTYGGNGFFKICIGPVRKVLVITDYKLLECVLGSMKVLNKSSEYDNLKPWLGEGLLTAASIKWKKHRKIITPSFHFKILEDFIDIFNSNSNVLVEKFEAIPSKESIDVYPHVKRCSLDIICETSMGTTVNAQNDGNSSYVQSLEELSRVIVERSASILGIYEVLYRLTSNYRKQTEALKYMHNFTNDVIEKRRQVFERNKNDDAQGDDDSDSKLGIKRRTFFLDCLLEATVDGRPLTNDEIREEVDTFMFEGHDTVTSGISFTLYCLAHHPEVQEKSLNEQRLIFGDDLKHCTPTYANLSEMKYLEQIIKESMRSYPPVPAYARETDADTEINGLMIPKGISLFIFAYAIQRDPTVFTDPEIFNPSRFDEIDGRLPYAYIPFSAGPRNCIGQKFAMLEMKSAISKVIRNFELFPSQPEYELKLALELILKSATGIKIGIKRRNE